MGQDKSAYLRFLNHLCDGEPADTALLPVTDKQNHLCDGERCRDAFRSWRMFLNHLCDGERLHLSTH